MNIKVIVSKGTIFGLMILFRLNSIKNIGWFVHADSNSDLGNEYKDGKMKAKLCVTHNQVP